MNDLYWIIALSKISTICSIICIIVPSLFCLLIMLGPPIYNELECLEERTVAKVKKITKKVIKYSTITFVIALLGYMFIPNEKQLYTIYGVGTVIDYAKGNKEVQKLPDNAVKCLNIWLEEHSDTTIRHYKNYKQ